MKLQFWGSNYPSGSIDLGDCPMCTAGHPVTEMVNIATMTFEGKMRMMSVPKNIYLKVVNAASTMAMIVAQQEKARKFRYNRMIYQGALNGTRQRDGYVYERGSRSYWRYEGHRPG
jgi:hypothetical protein